MVLFTYRSIKTLDFVLENGYNKEDKNKQEYRSGHNEAVLKTVWVQAHGGSNPSSCANEHPKGCFLLAQEEDVKKARINGGSRE